MNEALVQHLIKTIEKIETQTTQLLVDNTEHKMELRHQKITIDDIKDDVKHIKELQIKQDDTINDIKDLQIKQDNRIALMETKINKSVSIMDIYNTTSGKIFIYGTGIILLGVVVLGLHAIGVPVVAGIVAILGSLKG